MGYVATRKARLLRELARVQALLDSLYTAMTEMAASGVQSYKFDSGEGSQSTVRRSLSDIMDTIRQLEASEAHLINELYGMGIVSVTLRRKSACVSGR